MADWLELEAEAGGNLLWESGADALDPWALGAAEALRARDAVLYESPAARKGWTTCFSDADVARVQTVCQQNAAAAALNPVDRCSCIVMLNVALGQLLSLPLRRNRARGTSKRVVWMARLTTHTIEAAMAQLRKMGYAGAPTSMNFFDRRGRTAGTLKPEKLQESVQDKLLSLTGGGKCWFAFGLSVMDGYHSVLLLVDRRGPQPAIYWLDQFSPGVSDNVTATLDQRLLSQTLTWWQNVMAAKNIGYNTTIRLWPLRKRLAP